MHFYTRLRTKMFVQKYFHQFLEERFFEWNLCGNEIFIHIFTKCFLSLRSLLFVILHNSLLFSSYLTRISFFSKKFQPEIVYQQCCQLLFFVMDDVSDLFVATLIYFSFYKSMSPQWILCILLISMFFFYEVIIFLLISSLSAHSCLGHSSLACLQFFLISLCILFYSILYKGIGYCFASSCRVLHLTFNHFSFSVFLWGDLIC